MAITYNPGAGWYDVGVAVEDIKAGDHVKYNAQGNMVARLPPTVGAPSRPQPPLVSGFSVEPGEVWTTEPCNNSGCTLCNPSTSGSYPVANSYPKPDTDPRPADPTAPRGYPVGFNYRSCSFAGGSGGAGVAWFDPRSDLIHPFE
jgi:hypothetical protein